jgi:alpha-L-rhamnosidase
MNEDRSIRDNRVRRYVPPERIVWQTEGETTPEHAERLLFNRTDVTPMWGRPGCVMKNGAGILLDYGRELHGGVQLLLADQVDRSPVWLRIRFGESASEAMHGSNQDHAIHDSLVQAPAAGMLEFGNTGFRFVRIDVVDEGRYVELKQARAVLLYRDLEYKGAFESDDQRLNDIWKTGAYTVHLNMQDQVWDGIKRDRTVWIGDLHPEMMVISTVFGDVDVVRHSLDLKRDETPLPRFMNNHGSYSVWWIICHHDWYLYHGDLSYLREQKDYLLALLEHLQAQIGEDCGECLPNGFLDWPTSPDQAAVHAGLQALMVYGFRHGGDLCAILDEPAMQQQCERTIARLLEHQVHHGGRKSPAAMMVLAGMLDPTQANREVLGLNPFGGVSTFYGYYVLQARAQAQDYQGCLDLIRSYWGAMLDFGATTFWEDFDLTWTENAAPIDELVPKGKRDLHADCGDFCYKGLRHSLCHGWAGGPTAWLTEHVLGLKPLEPGCRRLLIHPHLADLEWVRGTLPTPHGIVSVSHERNADGTVRSNISAPEGITVVQK